MRGWIICGYIDQLKLVYRLKYKIIAEKVVFGQMTELTKAVARFPNNDVERNSANITATAPV